MRILKITTDKDDERRLAPMAIGSHPEALEARPKSIKSWIQQAWLVSFVEPHHDINVSSSDSRELHKGKNLYFMSSSRVPRTDSIHRLLNKSFLSLSILIITLTISCSHKFPKGHLFDIMILRKLLPTSTSTTPAPDTTPTPIPTVNTNKYIFLTVSTYNGNLGGISGADSKCQTEKTNNFASLPGSASDYKAFLVDGSTRKACTTSNCSGGIPENLNWVLKANTDYYRLDGTTDTKIFTTNSAGIVNFTGGETLLAVIDSSGSTAWWTGLDSDWIDFGLFCTTTWNSTGGNSARGIGGSTTVTAIKQTGVNLCSNPIKLLCVRQ